MLLFHKCCAVRLIVVAVDVVVFVAANVVIGVVLDVRFHNVCVVVDIAVVLPDVSGFLLEAGDVLVYVVSVCCCWWRCWHSC